MQEIFESFTCAVAGWLIQGCLFVLKNYYEYLLKRGFCKSPSQKLLFLQIPSWAKNRARIYYRKVSD